MKSLIIVTCLGLLVGASPILAADLDHDGLDDSYFPTPFSSSLEVGTIAVVDIGSAGDYLSRAGALGYTLVTIPMNSTLETLLNYSVVILPVGHSNADLYPTFDGLAEDYHMYVNSGGGLWISQPNPYNMSGGMADITWAPYALTLSAYYDIADCPPGIEDPTHCVTQGMSDTMFSFPGDEAVSYAADWQVLVTGAVTGRPGVMFAEYGQGKVLVEFGHPSPASMCPLDDAAIERYLECLAGDTVAISPITWDSLKAGYK